MRKLLAYSEGSYSGYIDRNGNVVIPIEYPVAHPFSEGLASLRDEDGKWWVINEEGEVVLSCDWSVVADVMTMESGYIDKAGRFFNPSHPLL